MHVLLICFLTSQPFDLCAAIRLPFTTCQNNPDHDVSSCHKRVVEPEATPRPHENNTINRQPAVADSPRKRKRSASPAATRASIRAGSTVPRGTFRGMNFSASFAGKNRLQRFVILLETHQIKVPVCVRPDSKGIRSRRSWYT